MHHERYTLNVKSYETNNFVKFNEIYKFKSDTYSCSIFEYMHVQMRGMAEGSKSVAPFIIQNSQWLSKIHKLFFYSPRSPITVIVYVNCWVNCPFNVLCWSYIIWIQKLHGLLALFACSCNLFLISVLGHTEVNESVMRHPREVRWK